MWPLELIWSIGSGLAAVTWISWITHEENVRRKRWIKTTGKIVAAAAEVIDYGVASCCAVSVTYEFVRCNELHRGIAWMEQSRGLSYAECEALALRLACGTSIVVRVDPANAARSTTDLVGTRD